MSTNPATYVLRIPAPTIIVKRRNRKTKQVTQRPAAGWLTMNDRFHWRVEARIVKQWRDTTTQMALAAGLRPGQFQRIRLDGLLQFTGATRRDTPNWGPTTKACTDALTKGTRTHPGLGLLPDDDPKYLHCEDCPHLRKDPQLLPAEPYRPLGVLLLTITDLSQENP